MALSSSPSLASSSGFRGKLQQLYGCTLDEHFCFLAFIPCSLLASQQLPAAATSQAGRLFQKKCSV